MILRRAFRGEADMPRRSRPKLVLGKDFVYDDRGRAHLTREYLLAQGSCCGNGCRNCPWPDCGGRGAGELQSQGTTSLQSPGDQGG
jgi:hypothetical protein